MSLADIALDMERHAKRTGCAIRELPRGLSLQLIIVAGYRTLSISRPSVLPSTQEIGICLDAFNVPRHDPDLKIAMTDTEVTYRWPS